MSGRRRLAPRRLRAPLGDGGEVAGGGARKITRHLLISGRVQGVFYRDSMRMQAERLGVTGWVRNRRDGVVEAVVHGEEHAVEAITAWAWSGPSAARVDAVEITVVEGNFSSFERLPTA